MKITVVTIVKDNVKHIEECIKSVLAQNYPAIEYIVVDGGSVDGTLEVVDSYGSSISRVIRGQDAGLYDALNVGIAAATGDVIGFLHSDDLYQNEDVIRKVADRFLKNNIEAVYGDLVYVDREDESKIIRYWKTGRYSSKKFRLGWSIPHPTLFVKKITYEKYGLYNTKLKISSDYEMMIRLLSKNHINVAYIPEVFVRMRTGGVSNRDIPSIIRKTKEDYKAWKMNGTPRAYGTVLRKNLVKLSQFFYRERDAI
ncbi:MAG: glycosyltransferase [Candidatus Omnitrophica bacterium]|nr:glycosyltransferase [Candidatus Omnitrophota bacterium]